MGDVAVGSFFSPAATQAKKRDSNCTRGLSDIRDEQVSKETGVLQRSISVLDAFTFGFVGVVAGRMSGHLHPMLLPVLVATTVAIKLIWLADGYRVHALRSFYHQLRVLFGASVIWALVVWAAGLTLLENNMMSVYYVAASAMVNFGISSIYRAYTTRLLAAWARSGRLDRAIAIAGVNDVSRALIYNLRKNCPTTTRIVGVYHITDEPRPTTHAGNLVRGDLTSLIEDARDGQLDLVIIALPAEQQDLTRYVTAALSGCVCDTATFVGTGSLLPRRAQLEWIGDDLGLIVRPRPISGSQGAYKTIFDRIVAFLLLIALTPAFALIALAIRLESSGPVFFRQERLGYRSRKFRILKFRTMYAHLSDRLAERQTDRKDQRVTRIGRLLRRTSLDELPQLINVARGEMSLVGPRPHALGSRAGLRSFDEVAEDYPLRHRVKPGITGLAQVNGCRGAIRSEEQILQRVAYDISYIEKWSFFSDIKILGLTLIKGFAGPNAL